MTHRSSVVFAREPDLAVDEFRHVLVQAGLGSIRPVDDTARLTAMLKGADMTITARRATPDRALAGFARCLTDFSWSCYVAELAVVRSAQGLGIGRGLLEAVRRHLGPGVGIMLASVPEAAGYYEHIGMERLADAFWYRRDE